MKLFTLEIIFFIFCSINFFAADNHEDSQRVFGSFQKYDTIINLSSFREEGGLCKYCQKETLVLDDENSYEIKGQISCFPTEKREFLFLKGKQNHEKDNRIEPSDKTDYLRNIKGKLVTKVYVDKQGALLTGQPNFEKGLHLTGPHSMASCFFQDITFKGSIFLNGGTVLWHNDETQQNICVKKKGKNVGFKQGDIIFPRSSGIYGPGLFYGFGNSLSIFSDFSALSPYLSNRTGELSFENFKFIHLDGAVNIYHPWNFNLGQQESLVVDGHGSIIVFLGDGKFRIDSKKGSVTLKNMRIFYEQNQLSELEIIEQINNGILKTENIIIKPINQIDLIEQLGESTLSLPRIGSDSSVKNNNISRVILKEKKIVKTDEGYLLKNNCSTDDIEQIRVLPGKEVVFDGAGHSLVLSKNKLSWIVLEKNSKIIFRNIVIENLFTKIFSFNADSKLIFGNNCKIIILENLEVDELPTSSIVGNLEIEGTQKNLVKISDNNRLQIEDCAKLSIKSCRVHLSGTCPIFSKGFYSLFINNCKIGIDHDLVLQQANLSIKKHVRFYSISSEYGSDLYLVLGNLSSISILEKSTMELFHFVGMHLLSNDSNIQFANPKDSVLILNKSNLAVSGSKVKLNGIGKLIVKENSLIKANAKTSQETILVLNEQNIIEIKNAANLICRDIKIKFDSN